MNTYIKNLKITIRYSIGIQYKKKEEHKHTHTPNQDIKWRKLTTRVSSKVKNKQVVSQYEAKREKSIKRDESKI